jgi:hypothetical protein
VNHPSPMPVGVKLRSQIEHRADRPRKPYRARVRWTIAGARRSKSESFADEADRPDSRLFTGPRGGRINTAVLRHATCWDDVVAELEHEDLRRHDLRHTGLTWMAQAGMPVDILRRIAGHESLTTTQRYLHPDMAAIQAAGMTLSAYLHDSRSPNGPQAVISIEQLSALARPTKEVLGCENSAQDLLDLLSGWPDSNRRPPDPQSGALPSCATARRRPDHSARRLVQSSASSGAALRIPHVPVSPPVTPGRPWPQGCRQPRRSARRPDERRAAGRRRQPLITV